MMANVPPHKLTATFQGERVDAALVEVQENLLQLLEHIFQNLHKNPNATLVNSVDVFIYELELAWKQNSKEKLVPFVKLAQVLLEQVSSPGTP